MQQNNLSYTVFCYDFVGRWFRLGAFLVAKMVKNLPAVQETWV